MDGSKKRVFHIIMPSLIQYSDWIINFKETFARAVERKTNPSD